MDEARKLVYCDRTDFKSFAVGEIAQLNKRIFDSWLVTRVEIDHFDAKFLNYYLKAFNDAYFICTRALFLQIGRILAPSSLQSQIERPAIVFPLAQLYLSRLSQKSRSIQLFMNQLEATFKRENDWGRNYAELQEAVCDIECNIDPKIFTQRDLTKEILSETNWEKLTETFNKETIEYLVRYFARSKDVWNMMCDAIKEAAKAYDNAFAFEDYLDEEGDLIFDENDNVIKVPRNPYDHDGNYILEPLERAGVFEFCDELKQKFDELVLTSQPLDIGADSHLQSEAGRLEDIMPEDRGEKVSRKGRPKIAQNIRGAFQIDDQISYLNERLTVFYDSLKNKGFIANDTDQQTFIDMFKGTMPQNKIVWVRSIKEFHYLFNKINGMNIMRRTSKSMGPWQVVCSCFLIRRIIKPKGNKAKEYSYEDCEITTDKIHKGGKVPKNHEELDKIIRLLDPKLNLSEALETLNSCKDEINEMFDEQVVNDTRKPSR